MDGYVYVDIARSGESNMEIDRQLLQAAERLHCAFVRLYRWREPTLSLGHFQATENRDQHAASTHLPLVLRASGGGAIVHDREWTYSIALPIGRNKIGAATQLYDIVHAALVSGLRHLGWDASQWSPKPSMNAQATDEVSIVSPGAEQQVARQARGCGVISARSAQPFLCFQRRSCGDIVCEGFKIVGSAQRRFGASVLQHGSILCAASRYAPELPGLSDLSRSIAPTGAAVGLLINPAEDDALEGSLFAQMLMSWIMEPLVRSFGIAPQLATSDSLASLLGGEQSDCFTADLNP